MTIAVLADEVSKQELLAKGFAPETAIQWADSLRALTMMEADLYMDLLF